MEIGLLNGHDKITFGEYKMERIKPKPIENEDFVPGRLSVTERRLQTARNVDNDPAGTYYQLHTAIGNRGKLLYPVEIDAGGVSRIFEHLRSGVPWAFITAFRSYRSHNLNLLNNAELVGKLKEAHLPFIEVVGFFREEGSTETKEENTFFVIGRKRGSNEPFDWNYLRRELIPLSKKYHQDSILIGQLAGAENSADDSNWSNDKFNAHIYQNNPRYIVKDGKEVQIQNNDRDLIYRNRELKTKEQMEELLKKGIPGTRIGHTVRFVFSHTFKPNLTISSPCGVMLNAQQRIDFDDGRWLAYEHLCGTKLHD